MNMSIFKKKRPADEVYRKLGDDEIVVKREDYFVPRGSFAERFYELSSGGLYGSPWTKTFKIAHEEEANKGARLETFLEDLATLCPEVIARFNAIPENDDDEPRGFAWDFEGAHAAADLLRSDADEKVKRDAIKKFRGK